MNIQKKVLLMHYPWVRYWYSTTQEVRLNAYGFLEGPVPWRSSELTRLDALTDDPCLILLGEPGVGKSHELRAEATRLTQAGLLVLWIDLGEFSSDERLLNAITDSRTWQSWLTGNHRLYLVLDGLDEGRMVIPTLSEAILQLVREVPLERLFLRISCRTADWPASFESRIAKLLESKGSSEPRVLSLAVLREEDIKAAAHINATVDPDLFLDRIKDLRVGALAARPVTLKLLLRIWKHRGGDLPVDQLTLYEQGCLELCREPDDERREKGENHEQFRWPDPHTLLNAAAWVASLTQLTNCPIISTEDDRTEDSDCLPVMIVFRTHSAPEAQRFPDRQLLNCLLRTGLLRGWGRARYAWAHRTYAEFLVARSLRHIPLVQLLSILVHPYGDGTNLVPQLHETAAWLASYRQDLFNWLVEHNPMVLLRSDVVLPDSVKGALVDHVLGRVADEGRIVDHDMTMWARKLIHPGLADQLQPVICDRQRPVVERHHAVLLSYFAGLTSLAPTLARLALDQAEPLVLRKDAADSVHHFGMPEVMAMLEPLARGEAGDDPNHELRAIGLRCMWPRFWSVPLVMEHMYESTEPHVLGNYRRFLNDFSESVPDREVGTALLAAKDWNLPHTSDRVDVVRRLLVRAWELRNQADVLVPLGHACLSFLRQFHNLPVKVREDEGYRRRLFEAVVSHCGAMDEDVRRFVFRDFVFAEDILWMLERVSLVPDRQAPVWVTVIGEFVHRGADTIGQWSDALEAARRSTPLLDSEVAWLYEVWELQSPKARSAKARHLQTLRNENRWRPRVISPSPLERAVQELQRVEMGQLDRWAHLCFWLGVDSNAPDAWVFVEDLENTPGWKAAAPDFHARIVDAAKHYVLTCGPQGEVWMGEGEVWNRGLEGYPALRLIACDPSTERIPADIWGRWVPILISFPTDNRDDLHRILVTQTYQMAPDFVIAHVRLLLEAGKAYSLDSLEHCWDERLSSIALAALNRPDLAPRLREYLAPKLIEHGYGPIHPWLLSEVTRPSQDDQAWQATAACYLLHTGMEAIWDLLKNLFTDRPEFGQEVGLTLAHDRWMHRYSQFPQIYSEKTVGELWHWFFTWFPPHSDTLLAGGDRITAREDAGRLRDDLLFHLANRGTEAACSVLRDLHGDHPEASKQLRDYLALAEENTRRNTWHPATSEALLALLVNREKRYIASADHLLEATLDALNRIQAQMHDRWNQVALLWDQVRIQPKSEQALSDFLALRLHEELVTKGVIVNREVEIKHGKGKSGAWTPGVRTDLLIEALPKGEDGDTRRVSVIIEVKGCWNKELRTAMQSQLVERYLPDEHCRHGIYLVGWFRCDAWDRSDNRYGDTPALTLDEARSLFDEQARSLAERHRNIQIKALTLDLRIQR